MKKLYCVLCGKYRKFEKPKISYVLEKTLVFLLFAVSAKMKTKKYLKKKIQFRYCKMLGLIQNILLL